MLSVAWVLFGAASMSRAFDMREMTPVSCAYQEAKGNMIEVSTSCETVRLCEKKATCTYVDNKVFEKEFHNDRAAAAKAGATWFAGSGLALPRAALAAAKTVYHEHNLDNPRFLTFDSVLTCKASPNCPPPVDCATDKTVERTNAPLSQDILPIYSHDSLKDETSQ